jgi:hypothetical protein
LVSDGGIIGACDCADVSGAAESTRSGGSIAVARCVELESAESDGGIVTARVVEPESADS